MNIFYRSKKILVKVENNAKGMIINNKIINNMCLNIVFHNLYAYIYSNDKVDVLLLDHISLISFYI